MSVISNNQLAGAAGQGGDAGYKIQRSLRFNYHDTPSLTKTFASAGNRRTWTWSGWVKRGAFRAGSLFSAYGGSASDSSYFNFEFNGQDKINIGGWFTGYLQTNRVFRDPSAWYHIVLAFDSTQSAQSNRIKLYVNGVQETSFGTANYVSQNAELPISSATFHNVGANASYSNTDGKFDGYLADVHFIDGQALAPSDFGEFDSNNVWQPKEYGGTYNNGTHYSNYGVDVNVDSNPRYWVHAFDGQTNTYLTGNGTTNDQSLWTFPGGISVSSSLKLLIGGGNSSFVYVNGSAVAGVTGVSAGSPQWYTVTGVSNLTSIGIGNNGTRWSSLHKIEVDGTVLTDATTGRNSFYLPFNDTSSSAALGTDTANGITFTVNNLIGSAPSGGGMDAVTYTGNGSTLSITSLDFQPDFVWCKGRSQTNVSHQLYDVVRGASAMLQSDNNTPESTVSGVSAFNSNGFTLGNNGGANTNGATYIAWAWRAGGSASSNSDGTITSTVSANKSLGFSIVGYTGTGSSGATVGHGLDAEPKFIIIKNRSDSENWFAWHSSFSTPTVEGLYLDLTANKQNFGGTSFNSTLPSNSVISLGNANITNGSSDNMIAYCWSEVPGFSKFGSYTGNGNSSGPTITTGFKPKMILLKASSVNGEDWVIIDTARATSNPSNLLISPNASTQEYSNGVYATDVLDTGFQLKNSNPRFNQNGATYIYAAFAEKLDQSTIDSLIDTPTEVENSSGNNGGNYATLNPLAISPNITPTLSNGNLEIERTATSGQWTTCGSTFAVSSGKYYWELSLPTINGTIARWGVADADDYEFNRNTSSSGLPWLGSGTGTSWSMDVGGNTYHNGSTVSSSYTSTVTTSDVIGVALDCDANTLTFYKNGTSLGTAHSNVTASRLVPAVGLHGATHNKIVLNFGQRPFVYTPPSGYKSLCTTNLPNPTIKDGSTAFDTKIYTGNGSNTNTISSLSFSPDLVWLKRRNDAGHPALYDAVRGAYKHIGTSHTSAEYTESTGRGLSAFNSDGFTINTSNGEHQGNGNININNGTYVAWAWDAGSSTSSNSNGSVTSNVRANPSAGFSIATFENASGAITVGHGLNSVPEFIIVKSRDSSQNWQVYHASLGNDKKLYFTSSAEVSSSNWNSTNPTSSVFTLNDGTTDSWVAYCFAPVAGYSAFGKYTGNGSADGPFVYTGFRVKWLLTKRSDGGSNDWQLIDATRSPSNVADDALKPNSTGAEGAHADYGVDFLSNGFKHRTGHVARNGSGNTYIYAAFAEHPFKSTRAH